MARTIDLFSNRKPDYYTKIKGYEGLREEVYDDSSGNPTIGIGHLMKPGEDFTGYKAEDFERLFVERDLPQYLNKTKSLIKNFEQLPTPLKEEMVSSVFRGGLSGSPKTINLINEGKFKEAADEFLDNDEYRAAVEWQIKNKKPHGVVARMENLARELKNTGNKPVDANVVSNEKKEISDFGEAFAEARRQGLKTFQYNGKLYTTEVK